MDDREVKIREAELERDKLHKRADVALEIIRWSSRASVLDGDEWKPGDNVDKELVTVAADFLKVYLKSGN